MAANWLKRVPNPFNLQVPPAGFLRSLAAFDADLVLYPSQQENFYRLARRARFGPGLLPSLEFGPDSKVCVQHKLVPVTSFGGNVTFGPHMLQYLANCDTWRHGGAKVVNQLLAERDAAEERLRRKDRDTENDARARSMWRTFSRRTGQSVAQNDVNRGRGNARNKRTVTTSRDINSRQTPPIVTPAGWQQSASGIVVPPTL